VGNGKIEIVGEVVKKCEVKRRRDEKELDNILNNNNLKEMLE
jgi:hypothetical protein